MLLLGTGSADGWPNASCRCASCAAARAAGEVRRPTAALVDDVLLLDCGPEAPRAALHAGRTLAGVHTVLLTHNHPDHSAPMALLARQWAVSPAPLQVVGSTSTLATWRPWAAPDGDVRFVEVGAGDEVVAGAHRVRVLAAAHAGAGGDPGLLFEVIGRGGDRLLWATDTGALPPRTLAALAGRRLDLLLLEETFGDRPATDDHLDLTGFAREVRRLRDVGAVHGATDVVAVHLSHHNPPDLADRLAPLGARPGRDLELLTTGRRRAPVTLVLGGARSGKSTTAEGLVHGAVSYVATGGAREGDGEWAERVAAHRARRPSSWTTHETTDVAGVLLASTGPVLVDCLTLWLTAQLDEVGAWDGAEQSGGWRAALAHRTDVLVAALVQARGPVVLVSNEVGWGVVPGTASGRLFADEQGRLNARLASVADRTVLVVAGQVLDLKGAP